MITLLFLLIILGAGLWIVEHYLPMSAPFRIAIRLLVVIVLLYVALALVGLAPTYPPLR